MNYRALSNFGKSKKSWFIAFLWGFSEGLIFFIIPDLYLSFIVLFTVRGGLTGVGFALLGSLFSAAVVFLSASFWGSYYHAILTSIPGISQTMIDGVALGLQTHGVRDLMSGPLSGIPYKIYSAEAALQHISFVQYVLWSIPARLERMLPVVLLALVLGYFFRHNIKKHTKQWVLAFFLLWIFIYIGYFIFLI